MKNGNYDSEIFIEYWSHNRFGSGNFRQKLNDLLTEKWELTKNDVLYVSSQLFNLWVPRFVHYFQVGDPKLACFIEALAAKLVWADDQVMGKVEPRAGLWGISVAGLNNKKIWMFNADIIRDALDSIEICQSRLPVEIADWLFDDLKIQLEKAADAINVAKQAESIEDCPTQAQECFAVTDSVRTRVEDLLLQA